MLVVALADDGQDGDAARMRLRGERMVVPELADLEVASVLRRNLRAGSLDERRARLALDDLHALPAERAPHRPLLDRAWELRGSLTVYDAIYVALAEALDAVLVTGDRRLGKGRVRDARCKSSGRRLEGTPVVPQCADDVLPLIRTRADLHRWSVGPGCSMGASSDASRPWFAPQVSDGYGAASRE